MSASKTFTLDGKSLGGYELLGCTAHVAVLVFALTLRGGGSGHVQGVPDARPRKEREMTQTETPTPQPEREEPTLDDVGLRDLSARDWLAVTKRAAKRMREDNMTMIASALAYSSFFAIPSVLLAVVGVFTLVVGPSTIDTVVQHLGRVMPAQATQLI